MSNFRLMHLPVNAKINDSSPIMNAYFSYELLKPYHENKIAELTEQLNSVPNEGNKVKVSQLVQKHSMTRSNSNSALFDFLKFLFHQVSISILSIINMYTDLRLFFYLLPMLSTLTYFMLYHD